MKYEYLFAGLILFALAFNFINQKEVLNASDEWAEYKAKYGKTYESADLDVYRMGIYYGNKARIMESNAQNSEFTLGINQFTDLTTEEFIASYLTLQVPNNRERKVTQPRANDSVDWRDKGAVSPVKDQGGCGSCWAFSATGNMESVNFIYNGGVMTQYSEQQLVDCSWAYGNMGCFGGWMDQAFDYVVDNGITTEDKYPYVAKTQSCKMQGGDFKVKGYNDIKQADCDGLQKSIQAQPTSVAVDASNWSSYKGGVFSNCGKNLNHGVLAVGYSGTDYWIVKNSWGLSWGEDGYIRVKMGDTCGICEAASSTKV